MSCVYPYIRFTRQGNTSTIKIYFYIADVAEWSRALGIRLRLVLQCINGLNSNPVEEEHNLLAQQFNSNTVGLSYPTYLNIWY